MYLVNMVCGVNYTTELIKENINALIAQDNTPIKQRFTEALAADEKYTYIVTGDSTRSSGELDSTIYYEPQLAKINFEPYNNASGGQTALWWASNTGNSTVQEAIDNTPGTGSTTILEMSLGINKSSRTVAEVKADIIAGLTTYLTAKPDTLIIFVSPNETGTDINDEMDAMYKTLPAEFADSVYVSGKYATTDVHLNDDFYLDFTHPNFNGLRRLVNYIFSQVLPLKAAMTMTMEDQPILLPTGSLPFTVQNGNWYKGGTTETPILRFDSSKADRRATTLIDVEPNFVIKLDTGGDNSSYYFADDDNNFISSGFASYHDGADGAFRSVTVPLGATKMGYSFSNTGDDWDASGKVPVIEYLVTPLVYKTQVQVNEGLPVSLPYAMTPLSIDAQGNVPKEGEIQIGQSDGTWLWGTL